MTKNNNMSVTGTVPPHFVHREDVRRNLIFSDREGRIIMKHEMLTDESLNLAQNYLHEAFPSISGLQDTATGATQTFNVVSGDFIRILHEGNLHWVCTSNISFDSSTDVSDINVFDSYNHGYIAKVTKRQMATFMSVELPEKNTYIKSLQQQPNGVDYGVFAIAFATALAFGNDPTKKRFDIKKMRRHLRDCLKVERMSPFPEIAGDEVGSVKVDVCKEKSACLSSFASTECLMRNPKDMMISWQSVIHVKNGITRDASKFPTLCSRSRIRSIFVQPVRGLEKQGFDKFMISKLLSIYQSSDCSKRTFN